MRHCWVKMTQPTKSQGKKALPRMSYQGEIMSGRDIIAVTLLSLIVPFAVRGDDAADVKPLRQAHAHNDYAHKRPLLDALDHGFCSVEADVFLVNGKLLVGHSPFELKADRTLEGLYLDPLLERVKKNGGRVYKDGPPIFLLIDFKSKADPTYKILRDILPKYREMLSRVENGEWKQGAVTVVISGDRPFDAVKKDEVRYAGLDGRPGDLDSKEPPDVLPMISDAWGSQFKWKGDGPMPEAERKKLRDMCAQSRRSGRVIRFWATPEKEAVWKELADAGVDLLNTDNLAGMQQFLLEREKR